MKRRVQQPNNPRRRVCLRCRVDRPIEEFPKAKPGSSAARTYGCSMPCKPCQRERYASDALFREKHNAAFKTPQALAAKRARGAAKRSDPVVNEKIKTQKRASYWRHREKIRAKQAAAYQARPEYFRERAKRTAKTPSYQAFLKDHAAEYRKKNRDRLRESAKSRLARLLMSPDGRRKFNEQRVVIQQRRRLKKLGSPAPLTDAQWQAVLRAHGHGCVYCGKIGKMTIDHVKPLSGGGQHAAHNVVPACRHCNARKHNSDLAVALERLNVNPLDFLFRRNVGLLNLRLDLQHGQVS